MTVNQRHAPAPPPGGLNVNNLGYFLDGWADLVEGMGDMAKEVRRDVLAQLKGRDMPDIGLADKIGYVSSWSGERRDYVVSDTHPGATTTVYIAEHGKDLYASWRTFIKPKFNDNVIAVVLGIAAILGFFLGGLQQTWGPYSRQETSISFSGWLTMGIIVLILELGLLVAGGRILKGHSWAFFLVEPNIFDAEDITAMSLSAHKSILRALDNSGIDISKLRLKQTFKGGRRGEEV